MLWPDHEPTLRRPHIADLVEATPEARAVQSNSAEAIPSIVVSRIPSAYFRSDIVQRCPAGPALIRSQVTMISWWSLANTQEHNYEALVVVVDKARPVYVRRHGGRFGH